MSAPDMKWLDPDYKRCSKCGEYFPKTRFYWNKTNRQYHSWCKVCLVANQKERYRRRKEGRTQTEEVWKDLEIEARQDLAETLAKHDLEEEAERLGLLDEYLRAKGRLDPGEDGLEGPPN